MTNAADPDSTQLLHCSFCEKSQLEVRKLIAGPTAFICDECILLCVDIIEDESEDSGRPAYRHCLIHADEPRYYALKSQSEEQRKLLEAAEPIIPEQYTALRESIAGVLRPPPPPAPETRKPRRRKNVDVTPTDG